MYVERTPARRSLFIVLPCSQDMASCHSSCFLSGPAESKWPPACDVTISRAPHAIGTRIDPGYEPTAWPMKG